MPTLTFKGTDCTLRMTSDGRGVALTRHSLSEGETTAALDGPVGIWLRAIVDGTLPVCSPADYTAAVGQIATARAEAALGAEQEPSA